MLSLNQKLSNMDFYKKAGTGRYSQDEQLLIDAIKNLVSEKKFPIQLLPECSTIEDLIELKNMLSEYEAEISEIEEVDFEEPQLDIEPEPEEIPQEPTTVIENEEVPEWQPDDFISGNYSPFEDQIVERSYTQEQQQQTDLTDEEPEERLDLEESTDNLSDLPPHTKRRAAEQTANTILKAYAQFAPMPFKWMAKIPEEKVEKMAFNGEIDLSIEVSDGMTFDDYMKQTNEQVDEIFTVDDDTLSDIKEPLIEVLMEQNMALTPSQRLMAAVLSHVAQMFTVALKLRQQNTRILSYQKHLTFLAHGQRVA